MSKLSWRIRQKYPLVKFISFCLFIVLFLLSSACGGSTPQPAITKTAQAATLQAIETQASPTPTSTPLPTATPAPPRVIFLSPEGGDSGLAESAGSLLEELAKGSGYLFEKRSSLSPAKIDSSVKVVAAVPPANNLKELANAAPEVQFLGIELTGLESGSNLSLIGSEGAPVDQLGFLAGAVAALASDDWRVGMIQPESAAGPSIQATAFANGVTYFCGLCRPAEPPYLAYPVIVSLRPGASQEEIQTAVDSLVAKAVNIVYIAPTIESPALFKTLSESNINFIAAALPDRETQDHLAALLQMDPLPAIQKIWPDLAQGKGGQKLPADLNILPGNPSVLTPGRETQAEKILQDLLNGFINPGTEAR